MEQRGGCERRERERDWGERAGDEAATVAAQQTRETNCGRIMEKRGWGCVVLLDASLSLFFKS